MMTNNLRDEALIEQSLIQTSTQLKAILKNLSTFLQFRLFMHEPHCRYISRCSLGEKNPTCSLGVKKNKRKETE